MLSDLVYTRQLGWLRMYPKHNLSFFLDDSAHRLHIPLPGDVAFDVETRVLVTNNDSSCVHGGLYVGGRLKGGMHSGLAGDRAGGGGGGRKPKDLEEWVSIGVLDHGDDARFAEILESQRVTQITIDNMCTTDF